MTGGECTAHEFATKRKTAANVSALTQDKHSAKDTVREKQTDASVNKIK